MIRITQLKLQVGHQEEDLKKEIRRQAGGRTPVSYEIVKKSIDARKKPDLYYTYSIDVSFASAKEEKAILSAKKSKWTRPNDVIYQFPCKKKELDGADNAGLLYQDKKERPIIIGFGPAGMFAGLVLARHGFAPIIFERGDDVETRTAKVNHFFESGELDSESNVQFGEGGAGTFSDGKLNTLVKDKLGRSRYVLEAFVKHGGPKEILYEAKPHIGTDILTKVVAGIREEIIALGGEIHFRTKLTEILLDSMIDSNLGSAKAICGIRVVDAQGQEREITCSALILAIGHSARDTFSMLYEKAVPMTPKAFAIGVRVEHPAKMINESQYGIGYPEELPTASYKLTHQCANGRGVYSFCMCPGGYVVNSSSEQERLCVNGMSNYDRGSRNSNSAIITTVTPEDFGSDHPLAGMEFQRRYEALAYKTGHGRIPVQLYGDFKKNQTSTAFGEIIPCIQGAYQLANLRKCLPDYVSESLLEGMEAFGEKIRGYNREDTVLSGIETRTSSPIRLERDAECQSVIKGLFPCGEGAGYAGGITSAAMDGLKVAECLVMARSKKKTDSSERNR